MQINLHYSCLAHPCRFKPFRGHLDSSNYLGTGRSIMNKVFPTSTGSAWWAFKVALHSTCVLLLLHERLRHARQSVSGGVFCPSVELNDRQKQVLCSSPLHSLLSWHSLYISPALCLSIFLHQHPLRHKSTLISLDLRLNSAQEVPALTWKPLSVPADKSASTCIRVVTVKRRRSSERDRA